MLYCGLDIGSTNIKVVLADEDGRSRWVKAVATPRRHDGIGIATDAAALVTMLEDMIIEGWQAIGGGKPLAAIAATGVGEDGINADAELQPLGLVIPWFDKRALPERDAFAAAYALTRVTFYTTATKWMWLRRHRAEEIGTAKLWIALTDYASSIWCGSPFMSETLAARTGCYDVFERRWVKEALDFCQAPPLPRVLKAGDVAGTVQSNRLRSCGAAGASTVIVAGGHDHPIASSTIQRINAQSRIDSIGTANAIYGETKVSQPDLAGSNLEVSVPARGGPGIALIGVTEFSATLMESFGGEAAVRKYLALPHLPIAGADDPEAARLHRVLEDMALQAQRHLADMHRAGVPAGPIFATGGWSRSAGLMELRASIFGEAIYVIDEPELAGLGAALLGLEGATGVAARFTPQKPPHQIDPVAGWRRA